MGFGPAFLSANFKETERFQAPIGGKYPTWKNVIMKRNILHRPITITGKTSWDRLPAE